MEALSAPEKKMLKALNFEHKTKYKADQLMEWSTSKIEPREGEQVYHVKEYGVNIAIKI